MKAKETQLLSFLRQSPQLVIPIYQRTYSWTERECTQLWDDVIRSGSDTNLSGHFIGSVVYIEEGLSQVSSQAPLLVIDGQQRLTTVTLMLEALARHLGDSEPIEGFSAVKIRNYYLLNNLESGDKRFKLLLTQNDRASLIALVTQQTLPENYSLRVKENFDFFTQKIEALRSNLASLCHGLSKLQIVDIALDRRNDNPQRIFESMNSTGRELSQADLIRNFILMGLEPDHQTTLYNNHWRPMEVAFGQEAYGSQFDGFMRHYLTVKTGNIPKIDAVYDVFRNYARSSQIMQKGIDTLLADIHIFAGYYCAMALGKETDKRLAAVFRDIRELKVEVAFPFLLELYDDYQHDILTVDEFLEALRLVESYVFRRTVCQIPTNSLNKTFATFGNALKKNRYLESIKAHLLTMRSYRRFPDDEEFQRELITRDLYNLRNRSYFFRRLENAERKEIVPTDEYTIEHILPQNENLSREWRQDLGPDWKRTQEQWLHTLGNLTLTGYNSEYSDRPFREKRDMKGGFQQSPLRVNEGLGQIEIWNEDTIKQRAHRLARLAVAVWDSPILPENIIREYRSESSRSSRSSGYTLADHPQLSGDWPSRYLYEILRREILALDPGITEDILKFYIAYKAETNFVDIIPQRQRLVLALNMPFADLTDPRGIAIDRAGKKGTANGDIEVRLEHVEDIPYVMGLIRQSLEWQLGTEDAA